MIVVLTAFWPALAAGLLLGAAVGWWTGLPRGRTAQAGTAGLVAVALGLGALAAAGIVPSIAGLWVEAGLGTLCAYLAGALLGAASSAGARRRA